MFNITELIMFYFVAASIPPQRLKRQDFCVLLKGLSAQIQKTCLDWMKNILAAIKRMKNAITWKDLHPYTDYIMTYLSLDLRFPLHQSLKILYYNIDGII